MPIRPSAASSSNSSRGYPPAFSNSRAFGRIRSCAKSRTESWIACWVSFNSMRYLWRGAYSVPDVRAMSDRQARRVLHAFQGEVGMNFRHAGKMQQHFLQEMLIGIDAAHHHAHGIIAFAAHAEA